MMCTFWQDVTDLFGTDLPVEGGKGGEFAWRDGPLLAALKAGHWVVLDEVSLFFFYKFVHQHFFVADVHEINNNLVMMMMYSGFFN